MLRGGRGVFSQLRFPGILFISVSANNGVSLHLALREQRLPYRPTAEKAPEIAANTSYFRYVGANSCKTFCSSSAGCCRSHRGQRRCGPRCGRVRAGCENTGRVEPASGRGTRRRHLALQAKPKPPPMGCALRGAFFHIHLLPGLCRMCCFAAAAAYCLLISSESHALLNQTPYEGHYFSIIILVKKTPNLLKEGDQVLFGKACFQQNQLVRHLLFFCRLFLVTNLCVGWLERSLAEDRCPPCPPAVRRNVLRGETFALSRTHAFPQYFRKFLNRINLSTRSISARCFSGPSMLFLDLAQPQSERRNARARWLWGCVYV